MPCTVQFPPVINFKILVDFSNINKKLVGLFVKNECKGHKCAFIPEKCICEVTDKLMVLNRHLQFSESSVWYPAARFQNARRVYMLNLEMIHLLCLSVVC